jgi:dethiobiotin synthetase
VRLIAVVGTGTGVGKTFVAVQVVTALRAAGVAAVARKPVQSFAPEELAAAATDAHLLGAAGGEDPEDVCPPHRWYGLPMAPPMAAEALGRPPFTVAELVGEIRWPTAAAVGLVETAGGVASPIAADGDCTDLVRLLAPDLALLVADAGLGTISAVRLAVRALDGLVTTVLLNRFDPGDDLHCRNRDWLREHDGLHVVTGVTELLAEPVAPTRSG